MAKAAKKTMSRVKYEKSAIDKKLDKKLGYKEGSKKDEKMDKKMMAKMKLKSAMIKMAKFK